MTNLRDAERFYEAALGFGFIEGDQTFRTLRRDDVTITLFLAQSDRAYVLNHRDLMLEGNAADLPLDRHLMDAAYLGAEALNSE